MSYDIWVEVPCKNKKGEDDWHQAGEGHNYTSNVGEMFYKAFEKTGGNWEDFHDYDKENMICEKAIPQLEKAIKELEANSEHYKKMNPKNGWGSYEGAVRFLKLILADCKRFPYGRIGFSV